MDSGPRRVCWDSCVWIDLIKRTPHRIAAIEEVIRQARAKEVEIWTPALALVEAHKFGGDTSEEAATKDRAFEQYVAQSFVRVVQVDYDMAVEARRLLRIHTPPLKKPNDAIHLATAVIYACEVVHTFDHDNLIPLDGKVERRDGTWLTISEPPPPAQPDMFAPSGDGDPPVSPDYGTS